MYVKIDRVRSGKKTYSYLTLAESYRNESGQPRHRIVARLGEVSDLKSSGELERIVEALSVQLGRGPSIELSAESAPSYGAMAACDAYFSRLLLDELFAPSAGAGGRLVSPTPCSPWSPTDYRTHPQRGAVSPTGSGPTPPCRRVATPPRSTGSIGPWTPSQTAKDEIEAHCFTELCNLTNLDLRLVCYDLTSTYFEGEERTPDRFPSKAFGYSRDHRGDRPQIVIGLLVTSDGIPIAHHVFSGNTADRSTLPEVMADLQARFGVGRIALVADRGLISEENLALVQAGGFDHVLATRLHRDPTVAAVLEAAASKGAVFVPVGDDGTKATEVVYESRRYVVVDSPRRHVRDDARRQELLAVTEDGLIALAERVRKGRLVDPAKIGAAADRILRDSGVSRCFTTKIAHGVFTWDYDEKAMDYEEKLLAGRYVITTSLDNKAASTAQVVAHYKALQSVERRFRVLKDFLALRPVFHYTEKRVRGHVAICVLAAVIEAVMALDLAGAKITDPDLEGQQLTARRALRELERIRMIRFVDANGDERQVITRPGPFQAKILAAFGVDTSAWRSRVA